MPDATDAPVDDGLLREIERTAVELARMAGAQIVSSLGQLLAIRYKNVSADDATWRDPVSEVDQRVEVQIRAQLAESFPKHDILGEEIDRPGRGQDFVWAVDPVDGTTNFINGFPMFAASIGVLYRARPVVGAVWCAASHALRAGVYHARAGGHLSFDQAPIELKPNPAVRRYLAGIPRANSDAAVPWETRKTGSAAIECAFVAAGLLRVASFENPNVWDIAGGLALAQSSGQDIRTLEGDDWMLFDGFNPTGSNANLRNWRQPVILGERSAVSVMQRTRFG